MEGNQNLQENNPEMFGECSKSKRTKISSTLEIKSNTQTLESLPQEILLKIFNFLGAKDLLNATLVLKYFNTIISNSSKLLSKITYVYNQWYSENNCWGSRKYPNVQIKYKYAEELFSLGFDKASVKVLDLYFRSADLHEVRKFLVEFVNLEELKILICKSQDSLTEFEIYEINDEIAEILNKFTKLKKLTVWHEGISKKLKSSTVESLELISCDCEGSFPFVKELHLDKCNITTFEDMKYLHKLTIYGNPQMNEISIPSVKVLTLLTDTSQTRPFKFETSNLNELEIHHTGKLQNWITDYLDRAETRLKRLKIVDNLITLKVIAAIKRNCSKIKCLETENCREESKIDNWNYPSDFLTLKKLINK